MRQKMYAVEYLVNVPLAVHVFSPESDPEASDYRALVSLGAFERRMTSICLKDALAKRFWTHPECNWRMLLQSDKRLLHLRESPTFINLPKRMHDNLWAFYRAVGWDYKKKKFSDQQYSQPSTDIA